MLWIWGKFWIFWLVMLNMYVLIQITYFYYWCFQYLSKCRTLPMHFVGVTIYEFDIDKSSVCTDLKPNCYCSTRLFLYILI